VRDAGVGAIVTSGVTRTRATAAPTAEALGVEPVTVGLTGGVAAHVRATADTVRRRFAGRTVLVVGHSNTVPAIIAALGGPRVPEICDSEYDNLFVLVIPDPAASGSGSARLVRSKFGARTSGGAGCPAMR
jgi:broad specificity phosphatase PhoE